jgi:vacuolar-type H+-ATPase subunit H
MQMMTEATVDLEASPPLAVVDSDSAAAAESILVEARTEAGRIVGEAKREAFKIYRSAGDDAERLVAEARAEAAKIVADARAEVADSTQRTELPETRVVEASPEPIATAPVAPAPAAREKPLSPYDIVDGPDPRDPSVFDEPVRETRYSRHAGEMPRLGEDAGRDAVAVATSLRDMLRGKA